MKIGHFFPRTRKFLLRDLIVSTVIFLAAIACCIIINQSSAESADSGHVPLIFVLAVALISRTTDGYLFGVLGSLISVFFVNYYFTYPYWAFNFTISGYPLTFVSLLAVSLIISAATTQIKQQEAIRAKAEQEVLRANLLRAVSHDIRTPLTSIVGASSALLEHGNQLSEENCRQLLGDINEDAHWLVRVVENLLSITRISGETDIRKDAELLEDVIAESIQKFRKSSDITVDVQVPQDILLVPMDAILVEQVLLNLMENSVRHGAATKIQITVAQHKSSALVRIQDNGSGIPREKLSKLFDGAHGNIGSSDGDSKRNMGIGLSVCRSIIRAHGGELSGRNLESGGAEFVFTLPLEEKTHENQRQNPDH